MHKKNREENVVENLRVDENGTETGEDRKHGCPCGEEKQAHKQTSFGDKIKECILKNNPPVCPPGSCTCPSGSCSCPPGSCACPPGSCTCPPDACACPPGSCACPEGACPQTVELVLNPSFETPCTPPPACNIFQSWTGSNLVASNDALTGFVAAELGAATAQPATLEQTICGINSGCPYEFSFSVNAQNLSNSQFTAQVFWQDGVPVPAIVPVVINGSTSGNTYVFIKRITSLAPAGTTCARILFAKAAGGSVLVDDVSFSG